MTLEEFVQTVRAGAPIGITGGMQDGVCMDVPLYVDPTDLDAITRAALDKGILPKDTEWSEALRIIDEAFQNTP